MIIISFSTFAIYIIIYFNKYFTIICIFTTIFNKNIIGNTTNYYNEPYVSLRKPIGLVDNDRSVDKKLRLKSYSGTKCAKNVAIMTKFQNKCAYPSLKNIQEEIMNRIKSQTRPSVMNQDELV